MRPPLRSARPTTTGARRGASPIDPAADDDVGVPRAVALATAGRPAFWGWRSFGPPVVGGDERRSNPGTQLEQDGNATTLAEDPTIRSSLGVASAQHRGGCLCHTPTQATSGSSHSTDRGFPHPMAQIPSNRHRKPYPPRHVVTSA